MNTRHRRAEVVAHRLTTSPAAPALDPEALRAMPLDDLRSLYREHVETAPAEDLSSLSTTDLLMLYRERAGNAYPRR